MSLATLSLMRPSLTLRVMMIPGKKRTAGNHDHQKRSFKTRKLDPSFVRFLHKSVQDTFRSLVDCASAED